MWSCTPRLNKCDFIMVERQRRQASDFEEARVNGRNSVVVEGNHHCLWNVLECLLMNKDNSVVVKKQLFEPF